MINHKETGRQLVHLTGIILIYFILVVGTELTLIGTIILTIFLFFSAFYKGMRFQLRKKSKFRVKIFEQLEDAFFDVIDSIDRKSYFPFYGAFTFYFSSSLVMFFFSKEIAILAIAVLAVQDSIATLIGSNFGKHKIFFNKEKTFEGSISGFLAAFLVCLLLTNPLQAFIASFIGTIIETLPIRIDDNLTIPLVVGIVLSFI